MFRDDFTEALGVFYTNLRVQIYSQQKEYRRGQSAKTVYTLLSQHNNRVLHVFGKSTMPITFLLAIQSIAEVERLITLKSTHNSTAKVKSV